MSNSTTLSTANKVASLVESYINIALKAGIATVVIYNWATLVKIVERLAEGTAIADEKKKTEEALGQRPALNQAVGETSGVLRQRGHRDAAGRLEKARGRSPSPQRGSLSGT